MTIQCASRIVVAHNVARQTIMVTTGAMNYLVTIIYYVIPDAATCMANASATIQGVGRGQHVQPTLATSQEGVKPNVVTRRPCFALITIPDASPTRLTHRVKVVAVVLLLTLLPLLTITAAAVALTSGGSGFCSR